MLISAWTSLFNIQWLVIGGAPSTDGDLVTLVVVSILFRGFACYLIASHLEKEAERQGIDYQRNDVNEFHFPEGKVSFAGLYF